MKLALIVGSLARVFMIITIVAEELELDQDI
jgi:hypothetical protein